MNERIKELMEQAKYEEEVFGGGFAGPIMVKKLDPEKFAELIVKECAKIADEPGARVPGYYIKKHFGVEE